MENEMLEFLQGWFYILTPAMFAVVCYFLDRIAKQLERANNLHILKEQNEV